MSHMRREESRDDGSSAERRRRSFLAMEEKRIKLKEKMLLSLQTSMAMFQQTMMRGRGYHGGFYPT